MHGFVKITAKDNAEVKRYRRLRDHRRAREEEGCFVAEGFRLVCDSLQYPGVVQRVFVTDSAWERGGNKLKEVPCLSLISDEVGASLADTVHSQGVFAICRKPLRTDLAAQLDRNGRYLVLCGVRDPGNMGMILRTADAFGMDAVCSAGSCDWFSPKVVRATMGSLFRLKLYEVETMSLLKSFKDAGICSYASAPGKDGSDLLECDMGRGCAVWIGNEGDGLSQDVTGACDQIVTIPMKGQIESLNAAMAAGIFMWEMMKAETRYGDN